MKLPRDIGPLHFIGIGGIGMSGITEVLVNLGYTVTGSDVADSANVKRLREKGIKVAIGHKADNLDGADVIVVSSAIKPDNPELIAARKRRLPPTRTCSPAWRRRPSRPARSTPLTGWPIWCLKSRVVRPCTHKLRLVGNGWSMSALPPITDMRRTG